MKKYMIIIFCFINLFVNAQTIITKAELKKNKSENYITFNPFGFVEPHMAIGLGFEKKSNKRSGYFAELSYLTKGIFPIRDASKIYGYRFLGHYRYHFSSFNIKGSTESFAALEFRLKQYRFPISNGVFKDVSTNNVLISKGYDAQITTYGITFILGGVYDLSDKIKLESTFGIGVKKRVLSFPDVPKNFKFSYYERTEGFFNDFPSVYDEGIILYPQFVLRIKYML
jgi:hypothetical protein